MNYETNEIQLTQHCPYNSTSFNARNVPEKDHCPWNMIRIESATTTNYTFVATKYSKREDGLVPHMLYGL